MQVFVGNESDTDVWFDDINITHTPTLIAQETHYDPWGLELVGIGATGHNRFTFNAQSEKQADLADGKGYFYETDYRAYDAQLGRFHGYDLLASKYGAISPYQFAFNNPVRFNDPTGLEGEESEEIKKKKSEGPGPGPNPRPAPIKPLPPPSLKPIVAPEVKTPNISPVAVSNGSTSSESESSSSESESSSSDSNKDYSQVFDGQNKKDIHENIAKAAENHVGEDDWAYKKARKNFANPSNKCNLFVYEVLQKAGLEMGLPNGNWFLHYIRGGSSPLKAGEWGNPDLVIPGWEIVGTPERGDVAAFKKQYNDASGHVGIYTGEGMGVWASARKIENDPVTNERWHTTEKIIYRRFVGFPKGTILPIRPHYYEEIPKRHIPKPSTDY